MSDEAKFISALRALGTHPGARGLADDAAVFEGLVFTHDMLAQGIHYLPTDPPQDVAWKLLAVNLSDLAAKGATPLAVLMGYCLSDDQEWDRQFVIGLKMGLDHFNVALLGGDTVRLPHAAPRVLGLTAIGRAGAVVPSRGGAQIGDGVFVTGTIGDAGLGLKVARGEADCPVLRDAYRRPMPQVAAGQVLAPLVSAMMDVSDGVLIDAQRMALASGIAIAIDLDAIPLSDAYRALGGENQAARLVAVTAGDDYQLLFTSSALPPNLNCAITRIGAVIAGHGVQLHDADGAIVLPHRLGWEH